jgi:hypothetical protein
MLAHVTSQRLETPPNTGSTQLLCDRDISSSSKESCRDLGTKHWLRVQRWCSSQSWKREAVAHGGTTYGANTWHFTLGGHMARPCPSIYRVLRWAVHVMCLSGAPIGSPCYVSLHSSLPNRGREGTAGAKEWRDLIVVGATTDCFH